MTRLQSRARREAAFLEVAKQMHQELEGWYDQHPAASFGEIEAEVRKKRRELMGRELELLINGRETGFAFESPLCPRCRQAMEFEGYRKWGVHGLEGDSVLERAYYVCPECVGETLFPLDRKLKLRRDHWSDGAARVAARQGLQAKSFDLAATAYCEATGGQMSGDSLTRITEGFGDKLEKKRAGEAHQVYESEVPPPAAQVVQMHAPIPQQANLSTDGGMVLVREEGWKEVKMSVLSEVHVTSVAPSPEDAEPEPHVSLTNHSYQVGLWDANAMMRHQYLEGSRRQIEKCPRLSSVNDGAPWIDRITRTNYPHAVQVLDWGHASERLWKVAKAAFGEGTPAAHAWAEQQVASLWSGRVKRVVTALASLPWDTFACPDDVRESPTYFETRQAKVDYAHFREAGYPIGSGTVESGINTVVHHRMKRQGRGWKRAKAQAMLAALGELHSGRFASAWLATTS
jgi:hypothetical protein